MVSLIASRWRAPVSVCTFASISESTMEEQHASNVVCPCARAWKRIRFLVARDIDGLLVGGVYVLEL